MKKLIVRTLMTSVMCLPAIHLAAKNLTPEYPKWYVGGTAGITGFGYQIPDSYGLHGAYFFKQKYGAGLVIRTCKDENFKDFVFAPAFFAHWGRSDSKLFFPTRIGLGFDKVTYTYAENIGDPFVETTEILLACYASAGIAIRPSKRVSFGINVDFASSFEWIEGDYLGVNFGISFHF